VKEKSDKKNISN